MTTLPKPLPPAFFEAWAEMQKTSRRIRAEHFGTAYARTLPTETFKSLWDSYDGSDDSIPDEAISGEAIHCVLNERGEGFYCAV